MKYDLFLSEALGKNMGECMYTATRINRLNILLLKWRSYFLIEMEITVIIDLSISIFSCMAVILLQMQ